MAAPKAFVINKEKTIEQFHNNHPYLL